MQKITSIRVPFALHIFLLCWSLSGISQSIFQNSDTLSKPRKRANLIAQSAIWSGSLGGLYFAWYSQYQQEPFHFFDDSKQWLQMDKVGHSATAYQISTSLYQINRWTGLSERKSMWWAAGAGFSYQFIVEVMDGFSGGWGFSNSDLAANTIGTTTFLAQQWVWNEQRIRLKYSYTPSPLNRLKNDEGARARNLFGSSIFEQWLKDYNGQTYWASFNLWSLMGKPDHFPKWLNVAAGYSANNMLGGNSNTWTTAEGTFISSPRIRQRQWLLSLDVDFSRINLPRGLKWIKPISGLIKIPFPTLELNSVQGIKGHLIYF